jgi:hypothetical protein
MNDLDSLRRLLKLAIARRNEASPFSPEWDAAMSHLDELRTAAREIRLGRSAREASALV